MARTTSNGPVNNTVPLVQASWIFWASTDIKLIISPTVADRLASVDNFRAYLLLNKIENAYTRRAFCWYSVYIILYFGLRITGRHQTLNAMKHNLPVCFPCTYVQLVICNINDQHIRFNPNQTKLKVKYFEVTDRRPMTDISCVIWQTQVYIHGVKFKSHEPSITSLPYLPVCLKLTSLFCFI